MSSDFFAPALPRIFAHRGLALGVPENTPAAFQKALDAGATHLETDVHASADGVAVVNHDPDLRRVAGDPGRIAGLPFSRLREIDLGGGHGLVSLPELLDRFDSARFNIDVKTSAAVDPAVRAIADAGATNRVLVTSFSEVCRVGAVSRLPGVATAPSSAGVRRLLLGGWSRLRMLSARALTGVAAVQVPVRYRSVRIVTDRFVRTMHAAGVEVHVWTVNDPAEMTRLLDMGVDGLVSDRCDLVREVVDARS